MFRFRKARPAFERPQAQPVGTLNYWRPEALPVGEVPPMATLAELAAAARPRDVWSGTRDTDRF